MFGAHGDRPAAVAEWLAWAVGHLCADTPANQQRFLAAGALTLLRGVRDRVDVGSDARTHAEVALEFLT